MIFTAPRHVAFTSLALAVAALSAPAQAQTTAIDSVIVTATRVPQLQRDVLADVTVITADDIARSGAGSITDVLQRQRGIEISRNGGPGTNSSVFIRGANSNQNVVLVDGVRIGSSTSGAANWSALPLQAIDRIEIVYGPMSALYGADAIGGVVQIFTKKGAGAPAVTAFAGIGSQKTREFDASVHGATGGEHSFSYAISAGKEKSDGFSATLPGNFSFNGDKDGYERESASGQFGLQLAKGHDLGLVFLNSRANALIDSGAPVVFYDARSIQKQKNLGVFTKNQFLPLWNSTLQYTQSEDNSVSDGSKSTYSAIVSKQHEWTWQNDISLGADTLQLLLNHRNEEVTSGTTPALGKTRNTNSVAVAYNMKRGAHLASASIRNDHSSQYGDKATGAIGYGYRISDTLRASATFGTSFRAPSFNELYYPSYGNEANKPEKGRNFEAGLQYHDGVREFSATVYRNKLTDMLVNTAPCPNGDIKNFPYGCAYNVNHVTLEGVTLAASHRLGAFNASASADFQDPKDETTGKSLARRAKQHGAVTVDYTAGPLVAGVEWQVSGKRFDDAGNRNRLGGYGLVNLYATYQLNRDWSLLARVNNVTDKNYQVARYYGVPGATYFAGIRYGIK